MKMRKSGAEVEQRPETELSAQMGGGYMTLTCHLNCFNCQCNTDQLDMALYWLSPKRKAGEALNIPKKKSI